MKRLHIFRQFLPLVLVFHQIKHNVIALLYWAFLFAVITDSVGTTFGLSYLFLSPEFSGSVSWLSFASIGFAFGGFTMAFHSYSYYKIAPRFPFLTVLSKPFVRFCMNNSLIPFAFVIVYCYKLIVFQLNEELSSKTDIFIFLSGFFLGFSIFLFFAFAYFFPMNKNVKDILRKKSPEVLEKIQRIKRFKAFSKGKKYEYIYFSKYFFPKYSRPINHYTEEMLSAVFLQNRLSTSIFELMTIASFIVFGWLGLRNDIFVPAGTSILLLLTILLLLFSMLYSWLKNFTYLVIISCVILFSIISSNYNAFRFENKLPGIDYTSKKEYSIQRIDKLANDDAKFQKDSLKYITLLSNWKKQTGKKKPYLIVLNASGGGSRSAAWTFEVMYQLDSISEGEFSKQCQFIAGASGGMLGAAFYRSIHLRQNDSDLEEKARKSIKNDLLNDLSFVASTNDLFFRYSVNHNGGKVKLNRSIAFENNLNRNTFNLLNVPLKNRRKYEFSGKAPVIVYTPTILNDGRQLVFSSQSLSFLGKQEPINGMESSYQTVVASEILGDDFVNNLSETSVLRMNATFPFVLPMTTLPTNPSIELSDAGVRDNFGGVITCKFLNFFRKWIEKETAGVIIVQARDSKKIMGDNKLRFMNFSNRLTAPIDSWFSNFPRTHDYEQDQLLYLTLEQLKVKTTVLTYNLRTASKDRVSLSWHLTKREKQFVENAMNQFENNKNRFKLKRLLSDRN